MDFSILSVQRAIEETGSTSQGLAPADAKRRYLEEGPNQLSRGQTIPWWRRITEPFRSWFVIILLVAGIISVVNKEALDAAVILAIVGLNALIFYVQQYSTGRVLQALRSQDQRVVTVLRGGKPQSIPTTELVPGDVVLLAEGVKVPADGRLLIADNLTIDEALLTGESQPVTKTTTILEKPAPLYHRHNMAFMGSLVQSGSGELLVTATGDETELGHIARLAAPTRHVSPLEQQMNRLTSRVVVITGGVMALAFMLALYRGIAPSEALRFLISLSVSIIPEGLPVAITLVLVFGMRRLAGRKALVRNLAAVETLGQVQIVATDKTGTITKGRLSIAEYSPFLQSVSEFQDIIRHAVLQYHGHTEDPVEAAMAGSLKVSNAATLSGTFKQVLPFDQSARMSGALWKQNDHTVIYVKGAAESVLQACQLTPKLRTEIEHEVHVLATKGFRVIAVASGLHTGHNAIRLGELHGLTYAGLIALADEIRPDVTAAVTTAHAAGIDVIMLTGDHLSTATTVGQSVGIITREDQAAHGDVLTGSTPESIRKLILRVKVFARVLPEHKYAILDAYSGHRITAMTGDGINDVPALTKANVGIAIGKGSDAAKEAADIILLGNDFATIIEAIHQGRVILANVRKMLMYLFATSTGEVITMVGALLLGLPLPVTAIQILWINLVTDSLTVIPLGLEGPERGVMNQRPIPAGRPILSRRHMARLIGSGLLMASITLGLFAHYHAVSPMVAGTMAFYTLVAMQWANIILMRKERASIFSISGPTNWLLVGGLAVGILLQGLIVFGPLRAVFHTQPLAQHQFAVIGAAFMLALIGGEVLKFITRPKLTK